jgi:TonB family protein
MNHRRLGIGSVLVLAVAGLAGASDAVGHENFNEGVSAPYLLPESRVSPEYPAAAFDARMEGSVVLAALVRQDGTVAYVETLESSAPGLGFEAAAQDAVMQWQFEPGLKDGQVIDAYAVVRLSFRRSGGTAGSGFVSANFAPPDMLGASIVASLANAAPADRAVGLSTMGGDLDPERGGYHPRIPPGLYPGGSYHRKDWWPAREFDLGDQVHGSDRVRFDVNTK